MKNTLRQMAMAYRQQLAGDDLQALGQEITASLSTLLQTFEPCTVGLFYPTKGEPEILNILENSGLSSFAWALPVCSESSKGPILRFASFQRGDQLEAGRYNIPVPVCKNWVQPTLLLLPCLAFHRDGARLGYGAGWYDRTLAQLEAKPVTVGVAYSTTESPDSFAEHHDYLLDFVVTEKSAITCTGRKSQ
ncbi:MAG: 5-formyltetrahydrofolate cyclo-ligase [Limnobacter sp.]|uniref:5-formyltetrahydrofolate cyclo-ligase n=1 Tax=Limnobacter sp. TaxID=2003368 RepID=UPI0022C68CCD|nr:5-formyltetrahydrofolate cyclo-ligase [Limnobacter sp.]MCZ8016856.1 5-formyltetrahydrofolate cyclo-ligase [Limnobacter sp.]